MVRQFHAYANPSKDSAAFAPYVVVLQSHHLNVLDTVIVAPLIMDAGRPLAPFDVPIYLNSETLVLAVAELGGIWRGSLRRPVADLSPHEDRIRPALDKLFTGF